MDQTAGSPKIAIRCHICGRIMAFKLGKTAGRLQIKCPKCGAEQQVDLSLRRCVAVRSGTDHRYNRINTSLTPCNGPLR